MLATVDKRFKVEQATAHRAFVEQNEFCRAKTRFLLRREAELEDVAKHIETHGLTQQRMAVERARGELAQAKHVLHGIQRDMRMLDAEEEHGEARAVAEQARVAQAQEHVKFGQHNLRIVKSLIPSASAEEDPHALLRALAPTALVEVAAGGDGTEEDVATRQKLLRRVVEDLDASLAARKSHLDRTSKASSTAVEDDTTVLGLERSVLAKARRTLDERVARSERAVRDARANAEGERTVLSQALLARHMVHQRRQLFVHACEAYGAAFETASHYRARIASQVDEAQYFLSHSSRTTNLPAYLRSMQARVAEAEAAVHAAVERQTAALEALAAERDRIFHPHRPAQPRAATGAAPTGGASTGGASTGGASTGAAEAAPAPARERDGHGVARADEGPKAAEPERVYVPPYVKPVGRPTGTASVEAFKASVTGATGSAGRGDDESAAVSSVEEANARVMRSVADGDELVITGPMLGGLLATGPGDHGLAPTGTAAMTSDGVVVMVRAAVVKGLADGAAADADKAGLVAAVRAEVGRAVSAYVSSATGGSALAYPATPESGATEVLAGPYAEYTPAVLAAVERALSLPHVRQGRPTEIVAAVMTAVEVALDAQPTGATGVFVRGHYESVPASKAAGPVAADTPVAEQKPTAETKDGADRKRVEPKRPAAAAAAVPTGATGAAPTGPAHEATGATGAGSVVMPTRALTAEEEEAVRTAQHRLQGAAAQAETDAARVAGKVALAAGKLESAEHAAAAREDSAEAAVEAARAAKDAAERAAARAAAARADLKRARAAKSALATKTAEAAAAKREARSKAERAERRAADLEALAARVRALVLGAGAPRAEAEPEAAAPTGTGATGLFLPSMPATGGAATEADVAAALVRVTAKHGRGAETGGVVPSFGYDAASDAARAGGAGVAAGGSLLELLSSGSEAAEEEAVRADAARLGVKLPRDLAHADATLREAAAAAEEEAEREASRALALGAKLAKLEKEQEAAVEAVATLEQAVTAADADAEKAAEEARSVDSDGAEAELEAAEAAAERVSAEIKAQRGAQSAAEEAARELRVLAEEAMGATGATGGGATGAEALVQEGRAVMAEAEEEMAAIRDEFLTEAPGAGAEAASLGGATGAASMLEPTAAEAEAEAEAEAQAERASATGGETGATGAAASVEVEAAEARAERAAEEEQRAAAWAAAWEADREERAAEAEEEEKASATGSASDEHRARVEELLREAYAAARDAHDAHRDVESPKEVREMAAAIDAEAEARAATGGATGGASADAGERPAVQSATGSAEQPAAAQPTGAPATGAAATGAASVPGRVGVIHFVGHRAEEGDMCLQLSGATHQGEENHSGYLELWEHMPGHEDAQRWLHREDHALCLADFPTYCLAPRAPREAFGVARRPMTAEVPDAGVAGSAQLGASADFAGFRLRGTSVTLAATDVAAWTFTGDGRLCLASRRELCLTVQEEAGNDVAVVLEEATPEALDEQGWLFDSA